MLTTDTTPDPHPAAKSLPESTRSALADAAVTITGLVRSRLTATDSQWDKIAGIACQLRDLRMPEDWNSRYEERMKAWRVFVRLVNALCAKE
jgi:hypothetical protein